MRSHSVPNNFGESSSLHGVNPLSVTILAHVIWVTGGSGTTYYSSSNQLSFDPTSKTGTVSNVVLDGSSAIPPQPGTLTVNGAWVCP